MATCSKRAREESVYTGDARTSQSLNDEAALRLSAEAHVVAQQAAATLSAVDLPQLSASGSGPSPYTFQSSGVCTSVQSGAGHPLVPLAAERTVLTMIESLLSNMDSAMANAGAAKR